ncbi:MAG: Ig domain protein group 1 domain protein [Rhodoglobus sp.]|nr:Ig domain protein group 1 domain protein [Rhodoglobus sp.]
MITNGAKRYVRRLGTGFVLVLALSGLSVVSQVPLAQSAQAAGTVVFDSIPVPYPSSSPSLGFQATSTDEIGHYVQLAGTDRQLEDVTVSLTDWACELGAWNTGNCVTTPGATFSHPITVNVYAVAGDPTVAGTLPGALLATLTQAVDVPFRPSADPVNCIGADAGRWFDGTACQPGVSFNSTFAMGSLAVTLPNDVIVSVAYNTSTSGANPLVAPGPYDYLNTSLAGAAPTVGTDVAPDNMYWDTAVGGNYTDNGASGVDVLRVDDGWNPPFMGLVLQITASTPAVTPPPAPAADPSLPATGGGALPAIVWFGLGALLLGGALTVARGPRRTHTRADR